MYELSNSGPITPEDLDFTPLKGEGGSSELQLLLYSLARWSGAQTIVEIGVANGDTSVFLARAAKQNKGKAYGVDVEECNTAHKRMEHVGLMPWWEFLQGDSLTVAWPAHLDIDWLYVDGNHEDPHEADDIALWGKRVRPGGYMVIHDLHLNGTMERLRSQLLADKLLKGWYKLPLDFYRGGMICQRPQKGDGK